MKCFPIVYQHDAMMCGIACLQMICKYYGKSYSTEYLSGLCGTTVEGVSLFGLRVAANKLGFNAVGLKLTVPDLSKVMLPCIVHWNQNHFVVLYKVKGDTFYVANPSIGLTTYKKDEFRQSWISSVESDGEKGVSMFIGTYQFFLYTSGKCSKEWLR